MGKKTVLITGLTGLVGSGLFSYLLNDNEYNIVAICRENSDISFIKDRCVIEFGSISDVVFLDSVCLKYKFDMIVHIANKALIVRFAKLAMRHGIENIILVSSTYACSKKHPGNKQLQLENEAAKLLNENCITYCMIRPTAIFGARFNGATDRNICVFTRWVKKLLFFPLFKEGKAEVCPVWGKDVGLALYLVMKNISSLNGQRLIISGDKKRTFKELIRLIGFLNNKKVRFIYIPGWVGYFFVYCLFILSFRKIDKREQIDRLMEDKYFPTSKELLDLGFEGHSFEESYLEYKIPFKQTN